MHIHIVYFKALCCLRNVLLTQAACKVKYIIYNQLCRPVVPSSLHSLANRSLRSYTYIYL